MDKPVILISAICGDIGSSAVRALREAAHKIIGCDIKFYTPVFHLADKFYQAPAASDTENYLDFLKDIIKKENIEAFLPISEPEIRILNTRRKEIGTLGIKLLLNNRTIIETFLDKLITARYITSIGLIAPKTTLLREYDGSFGFPLIVKPRAGYGSKKLWILEDQNDLDYLRLKDDGCLIVQEYIGSESEEYTTGVFSDGNNVSSITFRRRLGYGGLSAEAILVDEPALENLSVRIAKATGLIGGINIQSRRLDYSNIFVPFEVNPRLSSTLLFRKRFGFDDAVWWLNVLFGKGYSYKKEYKSGRAIRCVSECYFDMESFEHENR